MVFILYMYIPCDKTFHVRGTIIFDLVSCDLDLEV